MCICHCKEVGKGCICHCELVGVHKCPGLPKTVPVVPSGPGTTWDIPGRHSYGINSIARSNVADAFRVML